MNSGERNESITKLVLIFLRDNAPKQIIDGKEIEIKNVGFKGKEYGQLPDCIKSINDIKNLCDSQINELTKLCDCEKAGGTHKADVTINGEGYSIKSLQDAPPALVNHTARDGWEKVCERVKCKIDELDSIIKEYWELREKGGIKEDTKNYDPNSPFRTHKEYLKPLLNYFLFRGTAKGDSPSPAKYILEVDDPCDISTWKIYGEDYLDRDSHWDLLVFCVRAKKGMGDYPNVKNKAKKESMAKWTKFFQEEYRGALHVRQEKKSKKTLRS